MMEFFTDDHRFWPKKPSTSPSAAKAGQSWDKISRRMEQELNLRGDDSASGIDAKQTVFTTAIFHFTFSIFHLINLSSRTIMAEALEKWPIELFSRLLPRVYQIIEEINRRFIAEIQAKYQIGRASCRERV